MEIRPVTSDLAEQLADLMDAVAPASRCSCMYWRIGPDYRKRLPLENRNDLLSVVGAGPPPGLLAIDDGRAVGWCQVTPRSDLPALESSHLVEGLDARSVWSISCFVIRSGHRRSGIATALVEAAINHARSRGAQILEAYPLDADLSSSSSFTGYASTFTRLGFVTVSRQESPRPIMRLDLSEAREP
ncbi:MAG: GNAT family N-acetyltransferase [Acidimicrobiia bacterium]|nr:GNAT family N-acetyltransferase [Acidimicrobiia bacterium]